MLLSFCEVIFGNFNVVPIVNVFEFKLFNSFKVFTDVLYFFAIEYRVSPFFIV